MIGVDSVVAHIQMPDETDISTVTLTDLDGDGTYTGTWDSTGASAGTYWVDIVATDTIDNSSEDDNSTTFTVTKISTTISCSVSPSDLTIGDSVTVLGSISPTLSDKTVTLTYTKPDGSTFTRTCTTNPGDYSDTYTPDVVGSWSVMASWDGDSTHEGASSSSKSFTVKKKGMCIIATATYGSELSPEVQFLREFRDNTVLNTFTGNQFIKVFNGIYYSFSPAVAPVISDSEVIRTTMKAVLYPLMGILHLGEGMYSLFSFSPDLDILVFCLVVSSLMSLVYLVPWALLFSFLKKKVISTEKIRIASLTWFGTIVALFVAEVTKYPLLTIASGAVFVIATACLTTLAAVRAITKHYIYEAN